MASFMDSCSVFEQRLRSCDVPEDAIAKLVAVGVTSLSKLAFCTSYSPSMVDDTPLVSFFKQTIDPNAELSPGVLSSLRRAFFEAHTFMLSDAFIFICQCPVMTMFYHITPYILSFAPPYA